MSIEDSMPPIKRPEDIISPAETLEPGESALPEVSTTVDPTQTPEAKAERETARLDRVEELRRELGATGTGPEGEDEETNKKDWVLKEDVENISTSFSRLSASVEELSSTITRNKFPRVAFDADRFKNFTAEGGIDRKRMAEGLEGLLNSVNRIRFPEEMMAVEARNWRAAIQALEDFKDRLASIRQALEDTRSEDLIELAKLASRIKIKVGVKIEDFSRALSARNRMDRR